MLNKTIHRQTDQVFRCLLEGLEHAPEAEFQLPSDDQHAAIGSMAMHIGGSIEHSLATPEFSAKWSKPVSNKSQCIAYVEDCKDELLKRFIDENDLLSADDQPEFFKSKLDRVLKLLRHVAHHTGEIDTRLRVLGVPCGPFV